MKSKDIYLSGLSHYNLNTPHKNTALAFEKFETAAKLGYADAYYFLGRFYGLGDGVSIDLEKAFALYEQGLELGSDKCGYAIGLSYHGGIGVSKDADTAQFYFKTHYELLLHEANHNDPVSTHILGTYYYYGFSVNRYILKAIEWFKKAADFGYSDAQYMLGMIYETIAESQEQNTVMAAHYYELAAKQDHPYALYALGINALEKKAWPIAIHYLERAAHQQYALAAYSLAMYFHEKEEKTPIKAYEWFLVAAKQNHAISCYYTGLYHQYGKGVKKDIGMAVFWYEKAAHQNEKNALYHLAMILVNQPGSNKKDVFKLLEKAALQDHHHAQYNLAVMYHKGDGVEADIHLAFEWYKKAAESGLAIAQYNLGMLYFEGKAVPKDENQAKYWWQKAADQGLEAAVKLMLSINNYDKLQKSSWQS
jgi:uncharacterized protein